MIPVRWVAGVGQRRGGTSSRGDEGKTKKKGEEEDEGEGAGGEVLVVLVVQRTPQRSELKDAERRKCRAAKSRQESARLEASPLLVRFLRGSEDRSPSLRSVFCSEFSARPTAEQFCVLRREEVDSSPAFRDCAAFRRGAQRSARDSDPARPLSPLLVSPPPGFLDLPRLVLLSGGRQQCTARTVFT